MQVADKTHGAMSQGGTGAHIAHLMPSYLLLIHRARAHETARDCVRALYLVGRHVADRRACRARAHHCAAMTCCGLFEPLDQHLHISIF